ncbi:hypothetical protein EGT74_22185 [Chitinophaga lutea]|uniref:Uncharacterized protein n=2 Tax=Chitinophaga lutea TaxID=2488634 RepID=A0A3N4PNE3_9BACT|nr:hypothetical protein EGT74_22185 [Chitinophaga lutea]
MVRAYIINHQDFAEDCGCVHYIAQAFDDQGNNNQLQASAPTLKLQDYVPAHTSPVPAVLPRTASPLAVMAPNHYRSAGLTAVFHPPCHTASRFFI